MGIHHIVHVMIWAWPRFAKNTWTRIRDEHKPYSIYGWFEKWIKPFELTCHYERNRMKAFWIINMQYGFIVLKELMRGSEASKSGNVQLNLWVPFIWKYRIFLTKLLLWTKLKHARWIFVSKFLWNIPKRGDQRRPQVETSYSIYGWFEDYSNRVVIMNKKMKAIQ